MGKLLSTDMALIDALFFQCRCSRSVLLIRKSGSANLVGGKPYQNQEIWRYFDGIDDWQVAAGSTARRELQLRD
jgi:hypothetical protein